MISNDPDDLSLKSLKKQYKDELARRKELHKEGKCPYCKQPYGLHTCRYKGREAEYYKKPSRARLPKQNEVLQKLAVVVGKVVDNSNPIDPGLEEALSIIHKNMDCRA